MANSAWKTILDTIVTEIEGLSITGIDDANIIVLAAPDTKPKNASYPAILVAAFGTESIEAATNKSDDYGYPCLVAYLAAANQDQTTNYDTWLKNREDIIDHFIDNRSLFATGVFAVRPEPLPAIDFGAWNENVMVSAFALRVFKRVQRRV